MKDIYSKISLYFKSAVNSINDDDVKIIRKIIYTF